MPRNASNDDIALKTTLHDIERLVSAKAVSKESLRLVVSLCFGFAVNHTFNLLKSGLGSRTPGFRECVILFRDRTSGLVASIRCGTADTRGKERPIVCICVLDRGSCAPIS